MNTLGKQIRYYRRAKRLSQYELSKRSGIAKGRISEFESEKEELNPKLFTICRLCKALEVTPNDLIPMYLWKK